MLPNVINLDALRAESRKVIFLGREYELGYIPSGAAIPIYEAYSELVARQTAAAGGADAQATIRYTQEHAGEIVDDTINFTAAFCRFFYPDVTTEEVRTEASKEMVEAFFTEIIRAIVLNSMRGAPEGGASGEDKENKSKKKTGQK